jgi:hypothetical protein
VTTPLRSVRVPEDLWQAATVVANRNGETISDVVREALREYAEKGVRAMFTIRISGKAMSTIEGSAIYSDPAQYDGGSKGAQDIALALNTARGRRSGRGWTYEVDCTRDAAGVLADYCWTVGTGFEGESDPETRADGRALMAVHERCMNALRQ